MAKVVNPRAIKRKIRTVQNLKKITKAMEMVSAAKLKKVQGRLLAIRPYSDKLRELLTDLFQRATDIDVPMLKPRPKVRKIAYVIVTADKGLAGSYNANILRLATRTTSAEPRAVVYTIGRKGGDFYRRRGPEPLGHWQGLPADLGLKQVREITSTVIGAYRREEVDEVWLLYTEFVNAVTFRPRLVKFLPFEAQGEAVKSAESAEQKISHQGTPKPPKQAEPAFGYIFEPGPAKILGALIPRYVEVLFYRLLLEALASEHAARMQAMSNATRNAQDLIESFFMLRPAGLLAR